MAMRVLSQKFLSQNLQCRHARPLNAASSTVSIVPLLNLVKEPETQAVVLPSQAVASASINNSASDIDFTNGEKIFAPLSSTKLLRSTLNLHAAGMDPVVDMGMWVMKSKLMNVPGLREVVLGTVKHTFYEQFCAGEDTAEVERTLTRLNEVGLKGMLANGMEYANDNATCDENLEMFLKTVELTSSLPPASVNLSLF